MCKILNVSWILPKGAFILEQKQKQKRKRRRFQSVALFPTCVFILEQFPSESESDIAFAS